MASKARRPRIDLIVSIVVLLALFGFFWRLSQKAQEPPIRAPGRASRAVEPPAPAEGYLLCHWNAENLFDDQDDEHDHDPLEDWFAHNPVALQEKLDLLARPLLQLNGGRGPDILTLVEVENHRAVELLRVRLNAELSTQWQYPAEGIIHRDNITGRRIEPAILTRLPARMAPEALPRARSQRIIGAWVDIQNCPLLVIASHWTSRVTDRTDEKRSVYADSLYAMFRGAAKDDPSLDMVITGDFNDEPDDTAVVDHLHAIGDVSRVRSSTDSMPILWDMMSGRNAKLFGTYFYSGHWQILDHVVVSPGLLDDRGWEVLPDSLRVNNDPALRAGRNRAPRRFGQPGNPNPRGPSDHFGVTVRLRLAGPPPSETKPL